MKTKTLTLAIPLILVALLINPSFESSYHNNSLLCQHDAVNVAEELGSIFNGV